MSVIARCAATPRTCDSANDVTAWTTRRGAGRQRQRHQQLGAVLARSTSSIRYFEVAGSTRPASRLTSISARPSASRPRRAQISARASRQRVRAVDLSSSGVLSRCGRDGRRGRPPPARAFRSRQPRRLVHGHHPSMTRRASARSIATARSAIQERSQESISLISDLRDAALGIRRPTTSEVDLAAPRRPAA